MIRRTTQWLLGAVLVWAVYATLSERNALASTMILASPYGANVPVMIYLGSCTNAPCQLVVYKRISDANCQFTVVGNGVGLTQDINVNGSNAGDGILMFDGFMDTGCGYSVGPLATNGWNVIVHGNGGNDGFDNDSHVYASLYGDDGNDAISALGGLLDGGNGNDSVSTYGSFTNEVLRGGAGDDCIRDSNAAASSIDCGTGSDTLAPVSGVAPLSVNCERIASC